MADPGVFDAWRGSLDMIPYPKELSNTSYPINTSPTGARYWAIVCHLLYHIPSLHWHLFLLVECTPIDFVPSVAIGTHWPYWKILKCCNRRATRWSDRSHTSQERLSCSCLGPKPTKWSLKIDPPLMHGQNPIRADGDWLQVNETQVLQEQGEAWITNSVPIFESFTSIGKWSEMDRVQNGLVYCKK